MMMRLLGALFLALVALASPSLAQVPPTMKLCIPTTGTSCPPVTAGNPLPVSGTFSATLGGFAPGGAFATLTATGSSASVALPAGVVVLFQNTGTTAVSCTLGVGSATAVPGQNIVPAGSTVSVTVGTNTFGACIDESGSVSNIVRLSGGAGLFTGFGGGGGGGGGGGAVTVADGADVTQGALADAAATAGGTGSLSAKLRLMTTQLGTLNTTLGTPFQAGGSIGNTTFAATQGTAANLNATVVGNGTFAVQLTGATNNINNIAGTISLPTGAATSALQGTGNTSLSSIDTKTPALGQALAAASVPVVLTAAQITTLTPLSTITVTQGTGTNLHVVCDSGCSGSGGTSSNFAAAFPAAGTAAGMSQGGNMVALTGTSGNLNVQCANCSGSGASATDTTAFTAGASVFAPGGGFFQTTATNNALTNGQQGAWQMTANRAGFVNLRNASGTEVGTSGAPLRIDPTGSTTQPVSLTSTTVTGTVAVTQSGAWSLSANQSVNVAQINGVTPLMGNGVTGTGSQRVTIASDNTAFAVNAAATLAAETTKVIGTVRNLGNAGAITDFAGQNAASPANSWLVGCQFNTTPTTITTGNASPCQLDNAGNLKVNVQSAVGIAQGTALGTLTGSMVMGSVTTAAPTYSTGQVSPFSLDTGGSLRVICTSGCSGSGGTSSTFGAAFPAAGTAIGVSDGTNMIALRVGTAGTAASTVLSVQGIASMTPLFVASSTAPVSTMNSASAAAGVTAANALVFDDTSPTAITENNFGYARMSANRNAYQTLRDAAGNERGQNVNANNAAMVALDQTTNGTTNAVRTIVGTTGGATTTGNIAANNTTAVVVKASAGTLYGVQIYGIGSAPAYLKIYNAASATCGSGTPVKRLIIPASATAANGAGNNISFGATGVAFSTGITYCVTTGIGDADTTAPAASTFLINLDWN